MKLDIKYKSFLGLKYFIYLPDSRPANIPAIGIGLAIFRMKKIEIYRHHDTIL